MDPSTSLEVRVATLERSLRRSRLVTTVLGLGAMIVVAAAFMQQPVPFLEAQLEERLTARLQADLAARLQEQAQEQLATQRLALTDAVGVELVALAAGSDGSLLVLTPDDREVVRLGGPPARRIGH
jgi:multidrug efflux pump subunit AcrB